jgi:dipeptidyl aminopeptidase/acylaminoacyl peptidase
MKGGKLFLSSFRLTGDFSALTATEDRSSFPLPGSVGADSLELSLSTTADRTRFVFRASSYEHAPEIVAVEPGIVDPRTAQKGDFSHRALSHFNDGIEPAWSKSASLDWNSDGFLVQGWLLEPKDYDPAKKYPMIVLVHGGPSFAETSHWGGGGSLSSAAFSALGYFVLLPNPRGSFGQGEAFTQANRKDFGYGDLRDIVAGVDAVLAKYPVDPDRVGITGWSYGGFMTMFAVTQTHRFRAAVAGAGISNWQSYYGENSIDQWMIPFFGASVYDDPAAYAKSSAINYIKQAKTPTLVVVGDRDGECPAPQSFEFWHALRDQRVPSRLVVYPNEGHGFSNPAHSRDVLERAIDWFGRYMPPSQ